MASSTQPMRFSCAPDHEFPLNVSFKELIKPSSRMAGLFIAWRLRHQSKGEYLASLRTQKGQHLQSEMGVKFSPSVGEYFHPSACFR